MQLLIQMQCLVSFTLRQLGNRDTCPSGNDPCDLLFGYALMNQGKILILYVCFLDLKLLLQAWKGTVVQLTGLGKITLPLSNLYLIINIFNFLTEL